jgi:rhamnose utilization protein RhaD (predicted bifunctional aldolase and dehydrogenase)
VNEVGDVLDECVHYSRLIGADPALVLHGGGNSSVKTTRRDITGRDVDVLFVKGSGAEMATIDAAGFTPLALRRLNELLELESLSDAEMMRELSAAKLDPEAPTPSVETLLHAFLPFPAVQHSHADVIVTLTNVANGEQVVRDVFGETVVVVPYAMPGFELAREVRRIWPEQADDETRGIVLLNHGLFTFGTTSGQAYEQHVDLIATAGRWLDETSPAKDGELPPELPAVSRTDLAELRREVSSAAGRPLVVQRHSDAAVRRFVARPDLASLAGRGPLTPDHAIRTKPFPLVGRDVAEFAEAYSAYFARHAFHARTKPTMLDPAPRIILDHELGMITAGTSARDAQVVADSYHHTWLLYTSPSPRDS